MDILDVTIDQIREKFYSNPEEGPDDESEKTLDSLEAFKEEFAKFVKLLDLIQDFMRGIRTLSEVLEYAMQLDSSVNELLQETGAA
jgi:hypothetical protein